jgi:hypothetical protein
MKKFLYLTICTFPLFAQAAELLQLDQPLTPEKMIIPLVYQMKAKELKNFSGAIRENFEVLQAKEAVKLPLNAKQATILSQYFGSHQETLTHTFVSPAKVGPKESDESSEIQKVFVRDIPVSCDGQTHVIPFGQLLKFFANLQNIADIAEHHPSSHSTTLFSASVSDNSYTTYLPNIQLIRPYVLAVHRELPLSTNNINLRKIQSHFKAVQHSLKSIHTLTSWNLLQMKYHLNKLGKNMGVETVNRDFSSNMSQHLAHDSFDFTITDAEAFKKNIIALTTELIDKVALPTQSQKVENNENLHEIIAGISRGGLSSRGEKPNYREMIKILFSVLPHLEKEELTKIKESSAEFKEITHFWKLYLKLTKPCHHTDSKTHRYILNPKQVQELCNMLVNGKYTIETVAKMLENDQAKTTFEEVTSSFQNPFSPRPDEFLQFTFYKQQLAGHLKAAEQAVETEKKQIAEASSNASSSSSTKKKGQKSLLSSLFSS